MSQRFRSGGKPSAFVTVVTSVCLLAAPALGASRQAQEKSARKACLTGDYATGVSILADLFVEHKNPVYVFNQARCLEQNSRYKDAIRTFEEFLRIGESSKVSAADRATAEKHIDECKAKLASEEPPAGPAPQPFVPPAPPPPPEIVVQPVRPVQIIEQPRPRPEPPKSGKGLVIAGIATGVVGVAAVGAGIAFHIKANNLADEVQGGVDAYTREKDSSRKTYQALTVVGYGVGAACIVTSAVLIGFGATRGSSAKTDVALVPALGPDHAGVLLHGGF
jgi:hypothetical protein